MQGDPEAYWNEQAGPRWIACQSMLDRVLAPVTRSIIETAAPRASERVLDIGCGCGSLCHDVAELVGGSGRVVGLDISRPMVDHARKTSDRSHVDFVAGDAQTHELEPASFDAAISRFGVMFFRDSVAAFGNVARALAPGGRVAFAVWQPIERNPWITWPVATIADLLPEESQGGFGDDDAPGPFRFADPDRARLVLEAAGFTEIGVTGFEETLVYPGTADEILATVTQIGPLSAALESLDEDATATAMERVAAKVRELHQGSGLGFPGAWWILTARR